MSCTTYTCWVNDGRPWKNCQPINDFVATLYRHGYTGPVAGIGDLSHLTAAVPEDHCPFSHTPWPGAQPYPYVLAIDIMPGEGLDIIDLGGRLFNDKSSNKPGTEPIKYINWTDSDGNTWHDSWQPNHTRYASTDKGHIHISFATNYTTSNRMAIYDPYGAAPQDEEDDMYMIRNGTNDGSIYFAPGYSTPSGKIAVFGFASEAVYNSYKAAGIKTIQLPTGVGIDSNFYEVGAVPWPVGSSSPVDHTHDVSATSTGPAQPV